MRLPLPSSSCALVAAVCSTLAMMSLLSDVAHAQRAIPSTEANSEFFMFVQRIIGQGSFELGNCDADQQDQLLTCLKRCNSPGKLKRGNCCCSASTNPQDNTNTANFGVAGSCRYQQQLLNFTADDEIKYESVPLSGNRQYVNDACVPVQQGEGECTCSLKWVSKWSAVQSALPSPTPSPVSPSPTRTPTPTVSVLPSVTFLGSPTPTKSSKPPRKSPTPTVEVTPSSTATPDVDGGTVVDRGPGSGNTSGEGDDEETGPTPGAITSTGEPSGDDDDDDDGVCVDEQYLLGRGFTRDDLVHVQGRQAKVWCPDYAGLPCGTEFHMVRIGDRSVSYRQLCEDGGATSLAQQGLGAVQCRRERMTVNSVWTHQWEEVGHGAVTLTMYDARYAEGAQRLLHRVMRSVRRVRL